MRREDFIIEGIPSGYEIREVDLTPSGRPICVLTHKTDFQAEALLRFTDSIRPIPEDAVFRVTSTASVSPPLVRCMGEDRVLLNGSARRHAEANAYVLNRAGDVEHSFNIGGPDEVLANEHWIVTHYNDQAMTSDDQPVDREGLAVFDAVGKLLWGFQSHFAGRLTLDVFFHSAAWVGLNQVGVYRDIDRGVNTLEAFIQLDVSDKAVQFWKLPEDVHFAPALTVLGDRVMFYAAEGKKSESSSPFMSGIRRWLKVTPRRTSPTPVEGDIVEWEIGSNRSRVVGNYPGRSALRGLMGGRFIASKTDGYTILSFD